MWKVYAHINKINNKKYVGITQQTCKKRWMNGKGYKTCPKFYKAINKYGWDSFEHIVLKENLTEEQAKQFEIYFIDLYKSNDRKFGYNLTRGGQGRLKYSNDKERKKVRSEKYKKWYNEHREENIQRAREYYNKHIEQKKQYNKEYREKNQEKYKELAKNYYHNNKEKMYEMKEKWYKENKDKKAIHDKKYRETHKKEIKLKQKKYQEEHKEEIKTKRKQYYEQNKKEILLKQKEYYNKNKVLKGKDNLGEAVNQYDLDGNFIKQWKSLTKASRELGIQISNISMCCKGKRKQAGGYIWK